MRGIRTKNRSETQARVLTEADLNRARAVRVERELEGRAIQLQGRSPERFGPCPACGGRDRFSINTKKQVWNCRGCQKGGDVIALVMHLDDLDFWEAVELLAGVPPAGQKQQPAPITARPPPGPSADEITKRNAALVIWHRSVDPRGTLAERYLNGRRLALPDEAAFEAIRFHPRCIGDQPGMVCLVRDIITNEPQGIHRTALAPDGTAIKREGKTLRKSLGTIRDGAIKLDPDEAVEQGLCIGEGVETCLAGWQMFFRPVWSVLSTGGVAGFPILPGVDGLHIFRENDANGASAKAVDGCAGRWYEDGRSVFVVEPDIGNDLNDELQRAVR
jgi:CHC2 zinc finger/Toprim domain